MLMALVPALDAADTIAQVVNGAREHVERVVVVDDGSADETAAEAEKAGALVIRHDRNLGKGEALKTGFKHAQAEDFEAVVTLDADTQHDPAEIPSLIKAFDAGADIVIGARLADKEKIPRARYYTNLVGVACISWRAGCRIEDTQSGFRVYRISAVRDIRLYTHRFDTETEILIKAGRRGKRIVTVPVKTIYTDEIISKSHFRPVYDTYRICMIFLDSLFWPRG